MRFLALAALLAAYGSPVFASGQFTDISAAALTDRFEQSGAAIPAPAAETKAPIKDWTVVIYMNGKSNVEMFALADMNKLEAAGSSAGVNVVVEMGRMRGQDGDTTDDGDWTGVRRYFVTRDNDAEHITSPVLADLGNSDMGNWRNVANFVNWAKASYPAKKYILILWDHGWGWIDPPASWKGGSTRSISHDFDKNSYIRTTDLKPLFASIGHIDLYASMACFMQMMEVAYEMKDSVDYIVGSEEVIQLASFDFAAIINALNANPGMSAYYATGVFTKTFYDLYTRPDLAAQLKETQYGVQLSAVRSSALPGLTARLNDWTALVRQADNSAALRKALDGVVRFEIGDNTTDPNKLISFYGDLYNFAEIYANSLPANDPRYNLVRAHTAEMLNYIRTQLVVSNVFSSEDRTGKNYSNTHGIAIHIPGMPGTLIQQVNKYNALSFSKASNWGQFIEYLKQYRQ